MLLDNPISFNLTTVASSEVPRSTASDLQPLEHEHVNIEGVDCVSMLFPALPTDFLEAEKEKQRRRKVNETVGSSLLFTPMLDSKCSDNGDKE